jgi:hypothetical protein
MTTNIRLILGGIKSYLPINVVSYKGTGGSVTARYCYSVWLRHLSIISQYIPRFEPGYVVELGPGDSIGLGLAALLSGADRYTGLDVLEHATSEVNRGVLDELVALFRANEPIPAQTEFPELLPSLDNYSYPTGLFNEPRLQSHLSDEYVELLQHAILDRNNTAQIDYQCPWTDVSVPESSADMVITQVALQDMERSDLRYNLNCMSKWLKPGGVMSHQIDFSCPGGDIWNHHWSSSAFAWKIVLGNRPYYVNRVPLSEYLNLLQAAGMDVIGVAPVFSDGLPRSKVTDSFKHLPDSDYHTRAALIVAVKRPWA